MGVLGGVSERTRHPLSPAGEVTCEDGSRCPDGNVCCRDSRGRWGCCPPEQVREGPGAPPGTGPCPQCPGWGEGSCPLSPRRDKARLRAPTPCSVPWGWG